MNMSTSVPIPIESKRLPPGRCRILNRAPQITIAAPILYAKLKNRCPLSLDKNFSILFLYLLYFPMILDDWFYRVLILSFCFCESDLRANATESDIGSLFVLVFPHADIGTNEVGNVFPRTAPDYFAFHAVGVFFGRITLPAMSYNPNSFGE